MIAPFTRYNLLSNRLYRVYKHSTGWQPVWQTAVSCIQPVVKPIVQPDLTTDWTNSGCSFNTVVNNLFDNRLDVCLHDTDCWQPVVSCKRGNCRSSAYQTSSLLPAGFLAEDITSISLTHRLTFGFLPVGKDVVPIKMRFDVEESTFYSLWSLHGWDPRNYIFDDFWNIIHIPCALLTVKFSGSMDIAEYNWWLSFSDIG